MKNVGFVVTASCDLPASMLENYKVTVLPVEVSDSSGVKLVNRSILELSHFYTEQQPFYCEKIGISRQNFIDVVCNKLIYEFDHLIIIAPDESFSDSLHIIRESLFEFHHEIKQRREKASIYTPFKVRVVESKQVLTGYGVSLYEALRLRHEKAQSADQVKQHLDEFKTNIKTFMLPGKKHPELVRAPFRLSWLELKKLKISGKHPVLYFHPEEVTIGRMVDIKDRHHDYFDFLFEQLSHTKLTNHIVNISYAGSLSQLRILQGFDNFHQEVKDRGGKLVHSMMSQTAAFNLGKGAVSVSFACEPKRTIY
ncbi:DegV family protein [Reinekea marina]|uniref:DegV family protein n=2 Tax=Reinekea marina TaxID=1310421 RepID=A0ABV7WU73_9GAMM